MKLGEGRRRAQQACRAGCLSNLPTRFLPPCKSVIIFNHTQKKLRYFDGNVSSSGCSRRTRDGSMCHSHPLFNPHHPQFIWKLNKKGLSWCVCICLGEKTRGGGNIPKKINTSNHLGVTRRRRKYIYVLAPLRQSGIFAGAGGGVYLFGEFRAAAFVSLAAGRNRACKGWRHPSVER
jgi:hypothetical protein